MRKLKWFWLFVVLTIAILFKLIFSAFYGIFRVSSESMTPTLCPSDYVLVKKKKEHVRNMDIEKGNIYVFTLPATRSNENYFKDKLNGLYIKRCVGVSGDTIQLTDQNIKINSKLVRKYCKSTNNNSYLDVLKYLYDGEINYYPHDSSYLWNSNNYGPLYIPKKNREIPLKDSLIVLYRDLMLYESVNHLKNSLFLVDSYIFKDNYYFFLGDNFFNSIDSRQYGPIPEHLIMGQATYIIFSLSKNNPYFLTRIFKKIK